MQPSLHFISTVHLLFYSSLRNSSSLHVDCVGQLGDSPFRWATLTGDSEGSTPTEVESLDMSGLQSVRGKKEFC